MAPSVEDIGMKGEGIKQNAYMGREGFMMCRCPQHVRMQANLKALNTLQLLKCCMWIMWLRAALSWCYLFSDYCNCISQQHHCCK